MEFLHGAPVHSRDGRKVNQLPGEVAWAPGNCLLDRLLDFTHEGGVPEPADHHSEGRMRLQDPIQLLGGQLCIEEVERVGHHGHVDRGLLEWEALRGCMDGPEGEPAAHGGGLKTVEHSSSWLDRDHVEPPLCQR